MAKSVVCDFCGAGFEWTDAEVALDLTLALQGFGLGSMCDACGQQEAAHMERCAMEEDGE